jgi:hypothetical protein
MASSFRIFNLLDIVCENGKRCRAVTPSRVRLGDAKMASRTLGGHARSGEARSRVSYYTIVIKNAKPSAESLMAQ